MRERLDAFLADVPDPTVVNEALAQLAGALAAQDNPRARPVRRAGQPVPGSPPNNEGNVGTRLVAKALAVPRTPFLWRTRNGQSFSNQPGSDVAFIVGRRPRHRLTRASRASRAGVLRREYARELRERLVHDGRVGYVGEEHVEPLAHRLLGDSQRGASAGVIVSRIARRSPSTEVRSRSPLADQCPDRGRDGGTGQSQLSGEPARPLLAAHDQRQEPVLGEGEVGARLFDRAGDPDQGEDLPVGAFLRRAHAESIANSSGS